MIELGLLAELTRGQISWPSWVLAQHGGKLIKYVLGCYPFDP